MVYLADRASDDGSGIWTSKVHIAADTELSKRSVQNAMTEFEASGLLVRVGKKPCKNGYTFEYKLNIGVLLALPSTREETGAGGAPVQEVHLTRAGDSPHGVQEVHPNHPRTTLEPPNTCESDLFSANEEPEVQLEQSADQFDEFWSAFPKKAGKDAARKAWAKAIKRETPDRIIAAAKKYAEWLVNPKPGEFRPSPKYPQGWLNDGRWDEFLGAAEIYNFDDLNMNAQNILLDGRCPPSMLVDGKPNATAQYWLKKLGKVPA
nr:hypothetical protein [Ruegeria sp. EL01]